MLKQPLPNCDPESFSMAFPYAVSSLSEGGWLTEFDAAGVHGVCKDLQCVAWPSHVNRFL